MSRPNKAVYAIMKKRFEEMLNNGDFPQVNWSTSTSESGIVLRSYNMIEYSITWATFACLVSKVLKDNNIAQEGIFTRLRNSDFLSILTGICIGITADRVKTCKERYTTWAD